MKALAATILFAVLPAPSVSREQLIPMPTVVKAEVAEATAGSFIVAGTNAFAAWARKFSVDGETLWEYTSGAVSKGYPPRIPDYLGIAPMPDGSTFLCGKLPHDPGTTESSALLTHVDAKGKRLDETIVSPRRQTGNQVRYSVFESCLASGANVILQGVVLRAADGSAPGHATQSYWFVATDEKGRIVWQQEVPVRPFHVDRGNTLLQIGQQFFFSNTNNQQTELLRLSTSGELLGRITLGGAFHLVRNVHGEPRVELWGANRGQGQLLRFTDELKETGRITGSVPEAMSTSLAFELPDGTLCLFGSNVHSVGQRIRPVVTRVDAALRTVQTFEPSWNSTNVIVDLPAVALLNSKGDFISATGVALKRDTPDSLALDYLRFQ